MKNSKEFKIGAFVVVVLVAAFFLINYLRGEDIMNKEIELVSRYDNIEGLVASAPVYIKGFKAGKVSEVIYQPETDDFKVVCSVKKEFRIPDDSHMTIYAVDIMGGKGVRIDMGESENMASDGDFLSPSYEAGLMDGLASEIGPLLNKVNTTLDSLGTTVAGVNRILSDDNTASISKTLTHLEGTMSDMRKLASAVEGKSSELENFIANLATLSEYCLPFVKVGGSFVPMKSAKTDEEIAEGKKAIHVLGGQIAKVDSFELLDCGERTIINVKKISPTPAKYPRSSAKIAKNPIK